jgi:hypothetical protein
MNGRPKGRQRDLIARKEWTARLNRFAAAKTSKQRQATIETALKINPGGTLREMLQAWGYSASARGRKAKQSAEEKSATPARERLELTLATLFGKTPSPVPSLYAKLAGRVDTTVKDACRIVAALIFAWPESLGVLHGTTSKKARDAACSLAELFIRELLTELSGGRSREWAAGDMDIRVFRLVDEERVGVSQFIKGAGEEEGALIVAGARNILIGTHPVDVIREFHRVTSQFVGKDHKGLLIFVLNAAIFESGPEGFNLINNIGLLAAAVTAFALMPGDYNYINPIQDYKVDWSAWRTLSSRCCVVLRKPPLIDPSTGQFLKPHRFDDFIAGWRPEQKFDRLGELRGFVRFDSNHVLPRTYPSKFGEDVLGKDLYWDVLVRPTQSELDGLGVQYFIAPLPQTAKTAAALRGSEEPQRERGRPALTTMSIEEDFFYVIRKESPGPHYDDAQRAIYMAARGRLNLDQGERHGQNLNAAAALRQIGYEVLPISIMLSLFPRALHFAAAEQPETNDGEKP